MNHTQTTSFTVNGQTASVADNLGNTVYDTYGHGGELLTTTDALSHTSGDKYDSCYRLVQTTDANGGVTSLTLDGVGNTVALVDPAMNETDWTFNAVNKPLTERNALGTTTTGYDASLDVTSIQDGDGRVRDFAYNNLHELTAENWMSGGTIVASMAYGYDAAGELTSASDPNSAYAFTFDGDGNTLTVDNRGTPGVPNVIITGAYDAAGDMTSQSATIAGTKDFLNSYSYDADQRLTMVQQQGQTGGNVVSPKEIDYAYNALGQFTTVTDFSTLSGPRSDVATSNSSYDADDRLIDLSYTSNGRATTIDAFGWSYNAGSLVTSFTSADGTASYGYDPTNQLTSATYTTATGGHQPANESYSFDANGNRNSTGYTTGGDNLITSDGTFNYTHDADGNTISRTRISSSYASDHLTTYTWDYRNRLTDVEYYDNNSVLTKHVYYVYDVFNGLIGEEDDATGGGTYNHIERYIVERGQPILELDGGGNLTERNLVALNPARVDAVIAQELVSSPTSGGPELWMVDDNLGSPREVTDGSGAVIDRINRNSVGQTAYESNPSTAHWAGYAGGHVSAVTSLIIDGARWYDALTGRWLSDDPSGFAGHDTNLQRYVGNDATNAIDPSGLFQQSISWSAQNGKLRETMTATGDNGGSTTSYIESLLNMSGPMQCTANATFAAPISSSSWLDWYASGFNAYVPGGQSWTNMMAPNIQNALGNTYLAGASDWQLLGISTAAATAAVAAAAVTASTAAYWGVSGAALWTVSGFATGSFGYTGMTGAANITSGGVALPPTAAGAINWGIGGAIAGNYLYGVTQLAQGGTGPGANCFVAGTEVIVPGAPDEGAAIASRGDATSFARGGVSSGGSFWPLLAVAAGIGVGTAALRKSSEEEEAREREIARRALFGDEADALGIGGEGSCSTKGAGQYDWEREIDVVCDALFHGDSSVPRPAALVERQMGAAEAAGAAISTVERGYPYAMPKQRPFTPAPAERRRCKPPTRSSGGRWRRRLGAICLVACLALAGWLGQRARTAPKRNVFESPIAGSDSTRIPTHASRPIEDIRVGERVLGENPDLAEADHSTQTAVDPATWRLVKLHADWRWDDGTLDTVEVETLQPLVWIEQCHARPGRSVPLPLDLTEMGMPAALRAAVVAIEPCPSIDDGPGHVVLTTVNHLNPFICELSVEDIAGHRDTIKPTGFHKFYSETRRDWISASELREGEQLLGIDGSLTLTHVAHVAGVVRVYNMMVEGEHVYQVSALGALVHNNGCGPTPGPGDATPIQPPQPMPEPLDPDTFNLTPLDDLNDIPDSGSQILPPGVQLEPDQGWGPFDGPWDNPVG